jgi:hypothetical protein
MQGSGFRVQGSWFRGQSAESRVQGSGFRVQGSVCRVQGSGFRDGPFSNDAEVVARGLRHAEHHLG